MRKFNRVLVTGAALLPLTFGAAGVAAADTEGSITINGSISGEDNRGDVERDEGILEELLGGVVDDNSRDNDEHDDHRNDNEEGLGLGILG